MNPTDQSPEPEKKSYEKPAVTKIQLAPTEAVLGACKSSSAAGPAQGTCDSPSSCYSAGS